MSVTTASSGSAARSSSSGRLACHAEAGRVDQEAAAGEGRGPVAPRHDFDRRRNSGRRIRARARPPGRDCGSKQNFRRAALHQAKDHRPRRAARAEHHDRPAPRVPFRRLLVEIGDEAVSIACWPHAADPSSSHSVLAAPIARADCIDRWARRKAASLCGRVTLPPAKPRSNSEPRNAASSSGSTATVS